MSAIGEASPRHVGFAPIQVAQIPKCELGAVSCTYAVSARMGEREGENASMISQCEGQEKLEGQEKQREGMNMAGGGAGGTTAVRLRPKYRPLRLRTPSALVRRKGRCPVEDMRMKREYELLTTLPRGPDAKRQIRTM